MKDDLALKTSPNDAPPPAAEPSSRVVRVTFFEDRAEVVRAIRARVGAGVAWVTVPGVSPYVDDRGVQARVASGSGEEPVARVLSARVLWRAHHEAALGREEIDALERERSEAQARVEASTAAYERAGQAEARASALASSWAAAVAAVPKGARRPDAIEAWRASLSAISCDADDALSAKNAALSASLRAEADRDRAALRLEQGSIESPRIEAVIEVQLDAREPREVDIEVTYRVPCALWRPEHLARLVPKEPASDGADAAGTIEIITWATVWQRTGERWDGIKARFSTARPAKSASAPKMTDDVLTSRKKTDQERSRVKVEAREQSIVLAGLDRGARAVEEMPGVDDGGEPLTFEPDGLVSITSDGSPFRVELARRVVDAKIERVLFPEVAPSAHIRATATLTQGGPLLAGPLRIARRQSLVGRSKLAYIGAGEPFEIGFGSDDGLRVHRLQDDERDTTAVLGTQKLRRTVRVYLSNLSGEARRVLVTERVPVSEIDDVEISIIEAPAWKLGDKDGFAKASVDLPARSTQSLKLIYEIRASAKVIMPF